MQTQDSSTTEASDTLFKDWMHAYYTSSSLPRALTNEDEDEDEDDYSGSNESPASSYNSLETREGSRKRIHVTGEFLQWGSDSNFGDVKRHYTPGPLKETVESMHEFQLMTLKCLLVNQSEDMGAEWDNELSEPPKLPTNSTPGYKIVFKTQIPPIKSEKDQKDDTLKAVRYKRRKIHGATKQHLKGTMTARETENEIDGMTEMSPTAPSEARRRRRRNREVKDWPMRSILSEEQRRQNHIKSEKKRRILINEGFDDLCSLVPSLGKGKFCKSTVLQLAGQWLEVLIEGNEVLEKQLAELKEQEDSS